MSDWGDDRVSFVPLIEIQLFVEMLDGRLGDALMMDRERKKWRRCKAGRAYIPGESFANKASKQARSRVGKLK